MSYEGHDGAATALGNIALIFSVLYYILHNGGDFVVLEDHVLQTGKRPLFVDGLNHCGALYHQFDDDPGLGCSDIMVLCIGWEKSTSASRGLHKPVLQLTMGKLYSLL